MKLKIVESKYIDLDIIKKRFHIDSYWDYINKDQYIKTYGESDVDRINRELMIKAELDLRLDLYRQYMCLDIDKIFEKYDEEKIINFVNKVSRNIVNSIFFKDFHYTIDNYGELSYDIKKKFYDLSLTVNKDKEEEYTIEELLKISRVCFDAAPSNIYDKESSDYFVYANENDLKITDDYRILQAITDSDNIGFIKDLDLNNRPKEFGEKSYYDNEMRFTIKGSSYALVKKKKGPYEFDMNKYNISDMNRGILMYIALREKGYNIQIDAEDIIKFYERYIIET